MDFFIPPDEVDSKKERAIIEKTANIIVKKYGFTMPSIFILETTKYFSFVGVELLRIMIIPWIGALETETESSIYNILNVFKKKKSIDKLIDEIEKLDELDRIEKRKKQNNAGKKSFFITIKKWFANNK